MGVESILWVGDFHSDFGNFRSFPEIREVNYKMPAHAVFTMQLVQDLTKKNF